MASADSNAAKPILPPARLGGWRLALSLWHSGGSFRNFVEFALIGAIVLAFLHGLSIDVSGLWRGVKQALDERAAQSLMSSGNSQEAKLPITPHMDQVMFDESYFAAAAEPLRGHLIDASHAYKAHDYQRMLDDVAGDDQNDRRVLLVRGVAMVKSADHHTFMQGVELLISAGKREEPKAIAILGVLRLVGFVGYPQDVPRGRALLDRAATLGDAAAARVVGMGYVTGWTGAINPERAVTYLRMAADRGDLEGTFQLARVLDAGFGVNKNAAEAEQLMEKAAQAGHLDAQMMLGTWKLRAYSAGVTGDPAPALMWLRRAAERGQSDAAFALGIFYMTSKPAQYHDEIRGAEYLRQCVERSLSAACTFAYATALQDGDGVPKDVVKAYAYYELSDRERSTSRAQQRLKDIRAKMSRSDIAQGDALVLQLRTAFEAASRAAAAPAADDMVLRSN
jgi:TPR repeat protein